VKQNANKLLIIYEDDDKELASLAKSAEKAVRPLGSVVLRSASGMAIPELLAANSYAFCIADHQAACWTELLRVAKGLNLAGRKACLLGKTSSAGAAEFAAGFAATELVIQNGLPPEAKAITDWYKAL